MTQTSTNDNPFAGGAYVASISVEGIAELTERMITAYLDSLYLLRTQAPESEDSNNIQKHLTASLTNNVIRELTETDIRKLASDVKASQVLRWFYSRMLSAVRGTSVSNKDIDTYIANTLAFYPIIRMDNEYAGEQILTTESNIYIMFEKFPFMKVLALFEMLNIHQEIEFRRTQEQSET